jgi:two-component SAPR family response regulator
MPGALDGPGLAEEARRLVPGIRVVLITGFANVAVDRYHGFDERLLLRKPFDKDDLARALQRARE